jgi:hypothetical protein
VESNLGVDIVDSGNICYQFIPLYQEKFIEFRHKHFSLCLVSIETTVFALFVFLTTQLINAPKEGKNYHH